MPDYSQTKQPAMTYAPLRLEDYDISPTHGFLPSEPPLRRLPDPYYAPWEDIMDRFNQYLLAHHIRRLVRKFLPASIAVPWVAVAEFLQLNPV
ncbi:tryptophan 2,3- dioxygenase, partial [Coemansia sp. RSA 451]